MEIKKTISYEDFGALGDGVSDDFDAICAAHEYANENDCDIRANDDKTYYIGDTSGKPSVKIKTNVDWGKANFIIDDSGITSDMPSRTSVLFTVCAECPPVSYTPEDDSIVSEKLREINAAGGFKSDIKKLDLGLGYEAMLVVVNENNKNYIRYGANKNSGSSQTEIVVIDKDGNLDPTTSFLLDYAEVTKVTVYRIDDAPLTLNGGIFTTVANQAIEDYKYYARNIKIARSNTTVQNFTHKIVGEGEHGDPYSAFLNSSYACNILVKDSFFQAHKYYLCSGSGGGSPVGMGTYDISASYGNNIVWKNCVETNFFAEDGTKRRGTWGIMASSYTKNIAYEDCILSRFDAHAGVYNARIINSHIANFRIIGGGTLLLENTTVYNDLLISIRGDYGSTWNGDIIMRDIYMINDYESDITLVGANWKNHDFGYRCYLAKNIILDNLKLKNPATVYLFSPDLLDKGDVSGSTYNGETNLNPYQPPKSVTIKNNNNGYKFVGPDSPFFSNTIITEE